MTPHIHITYCNDAKPVSDFEFEIEYQRILNGAQTDPQSLLTTYTSSMLVLYRVRVGVKRGECTATISWYNEATRDWMTQPVEPSGMLADWHGFPDFHMDILMELVG